MKAQRTSVPDQPAQVFCETCSDNFCEVCFAAQHRKGSRKRHASKPLSGPQEKRAKVDEGAPPHENGKAVNGDEVRQRILSSHGSHCIHAGEIDACG